jgi:hypothetical protein
MFWKYVINNPICFTIKLVFLLSRKALTGGQFGAIPYVE